MTHETRYVGKSRDGKRTTFYGVCTCGAGTTSSASPSSVEKKLRAHRDGDDRGMFKASAALAEEQRNAPITPVPGVTFHDVRPGDRVRVSISGRTGTIVKRCAHKRDGWIVKWDEPIFGVTEGRVAWANLEPTA